MFIRRVAGRGNAQQHRLTQIPAFIHSLFTHTPTEKSLLSHRSQHTQTHTKAHLSSEQRALDHFMRANYSARLGFACTHLTHASCALRYTAYRMNTLQTQRLHMRTLNSTHKRSSCVSSLTPSPFRLRALHQTRCASGARDFFSHGHGLLRCTTGLWFQRLHKLETSSRSSSSMNREDV